MLVEFHSEIVFEIVIFKSVCLILIAQIYLFQSKCTTIILFGLLILLGSLALWLEHRRNVGMVIRKCLLYSLYNTPIYNIGYIFLDWILVLGC